MNITFTLLSILLLMPSRMLLAAETTSPANSDTPRVAKFKDDRAAALSFTLDDNLRDQYDVAVPLLNKYGIHATFFVIPGRTPETNKEAAQKKPGDWGGISWPQLKELAAQGHEIANHTWMHMTLIYTKDGKRVDIPTAALEEQVAKGYNAIKEKIGLAPLTFCAPGNGVDDAVRAMALKYHLAVREKFTQRFGDWPPTNKTFTAEQANVSVDRAITKGEAMIWMIHAITEGYNAVSSPAVIENHLKYVKSREDVLWVDTFANVSRYTLERDAAKLTQSVSENRATFTVECPLDQTKFNYPLTVVIPVKGAQQASARMAGSEVALPVEVIKNRILVQVAPSREQVVVTWQNATDMPPSAQPMPAKTNK
ncbi:MAG: polysaccharide deacetylase family protein [bacterium]